MNIRNTTIQFIDAVNHLLETGEVGSMRELVDKMGWNESAFSNAMAKRRNVPHDRVEKLRTLYKIENYFEKNFTENINNFVSEPAVKYGDAIGKEKETIILMYEGIIKTKDELLKSKDEIIKMLRDEVHQLKKQQGHRKDYQS